MIGKMRGVDDSVERRLTIKPGVSAPPHALDREEIFIALSGRLTVTMDDEVLEVEPGDALVVRTNSSQWPTPALSLSRPLWCFRSAARV